MSKEEYDELVEKRNNINMLLCDKSINNRYRTLLTQELTQIRETIKQAHKNEHTIARTITTSY